MPPIPALPLRTYSIENVHPRKRFFFSCESCSSARSCVLYVHTCTVDRICTLYVRFGLCRGPWAVARFFTGKYGSTYTFCEYSKKKKLTWHECGHILFFRTMITVSTNKLVVKRTVYGDSGDHDIQCSFTTKVCFFPFGSTMHLDHWRF
jgi:hypothetical protein